MKDSKKAAGRKAANTKIVCKRGPYKWDHDAVINEAKRYKTFNEFRIIGNGAYQAARKYGWLEELTWLPGRSKTPKKPVGFWGYENTKQEAEKYNTRGEFSIKNQTAYKAALKNGWLDDFTWLKSEPKRNLYSYEECKTVASWYSSIAEFRKFERNIYNFARVNGWIKDYTWLKRHYKWTYEACYEEAKKYNSRGEFYNNSNAYHVAYKNGWLNDYTWMRQKKKWTEETCMKESKKYVTIIDFYRNNRRAYDIARINGWLDDYTWLKTGTPVVKAKRGRKSKKKRLISWLQRIFRK